MPAIRERSTILVTCPKGMPPVLAGEMRALGLPALTETEAGVETEGTMADAMRLNLHVRTGHRVLFQLKAFRAAAQRALYWQLLKIPWELYIPADGYLSVDSSVRTRSMRNPRFANLRAKDAIVDRIRDHCGRRPDSGPEERGAAVFLHWRDDECRIYLNTSGAPLTKRGYRTIPGRAPMQETLAAGVVLASGWDKAGPFVNPMCGSGTLAIEAAWIGLGRAPGLMREDFAFQHLLPFDAPAWDAMRAAAAAALRPELAAPIVATDIDPAAIAAARQNARAAGVERWIRFSRCDFADTPLPPGAGVVVLNPEYGERMGSESALAAVYARIGDFLKQKCAGRRGYVFTGNLSLAKTVGLRTSRRLTFFNGPIECRLLEFDLYEGSRREDGPPDASHAAALPDTIVPPAVEG